MIICLEYRREGEGKEEENERREEGLFAPTGSVSLSGTWLVSLSPPPPFSSCFLVTKTEFLVGREVSDSFKNCLLFVWGCTSDQSLTGRELESKSNNVQIYTKERSTVLKK